MSKILKNQPALIFFGISIIFIYYYLAVVNCWWPFSGLTFEQRGQFGDTFGMFTSLFSALGFGGVLVTLWYQHKTIQEADHRAELQRFESILFQLLATHNSVISDLDLRSIKDGQIMAQGRDCFYKYYTRSIKPNYKRVKNSNPNADELTLALVAYDRVWLRHRHNLGHYFRFIYNIFRFIEESDIVETEKKRYVRIVRSQLSDYELLLLFYNCMHKNGIKKFKPLVEKYALFNNIPEDLLLNIEHKKFYTASAFTQEAENEV